MQIWLSQGGVRGKTTSQPDWWRGEPKTGSSAAGELRLGLDVRRGEAALGFGKEEGRRGLQGACAQFGCAKSMPGTCGASRGFEGCTRQQGASQHPTVPIGLPRGATLSPFPPVLALFPGAQRPWGGEGVRPTRPARVHGPGGLGTANGWGDKNVSKAPLGAGESFSVGFL